MVHFQFQILSDLNLETPKARPSSVEYRIQRQCPRLALLRDIGNVLDPRLVGFLDRQLQQFEVVFYLSGNHEPYDTKFSRAKQPYTLISWKLESDGAHPTRKQANAHFWTGRGTIAQQS
jgi:hypothetical protein